MLAGLLAGAVDAAVLVHEGFDYDTGPLNNTPTSGVGQSGNWQLTPANTANATLSVADVAWNTPTGYSHRHNNKGVGGVQNATGAFSLQQPINFDADGVYYFSLLYRRPVLEGNIGLLSLNSGETEKARLFQAVGGGNVTARIGDELEGTGDAFSGTGDLLFVGRIQTSASGNDTIAFQVIPASGTVPDTFTPTHTRTAETTGTADSLYFWNFLNEDSSGAYFGNFIMGSTYGSVIMSIPEPTTILLVGLGVVLLSRLRRKSTAS